MLSPSKGLLHSIFFHRLLVNVAPRELRVLNTTVVTILKNIYTHINNQLYTTKKSITDSQEVETLIEQKIAEFLQNTNSSQIKQGKVSNKTKQKNT